MRKLDGKIKDVCRSLALFVDRRLTNAHLHLLLPAPRRPHLRS